MNYEPKFIIGYSIEDCEYEIESMYKYDYKYGCGIDRPRLWDLDFTIKTLRENGGNYER